MLLSARLSPLAAASINLECLTLRAARERNSAGLCIGRGMQSAVPPGIARILWQLNGECRQIELNDLRLN